MSRRLSTFPVTTLKAPQSFIRSNTVGSNPIPLTLRQTYFCHRLSVVRPYSSSSAGDEDEKGGEEEKKPADEQESDGDESLGLLAPIVKQYAIAPVTIPDRFPEVPVLPITRNPIFPRFVKMLEVGRVKYVFGNN